MLHRINIIKIVRDHFKTLRNVNSTSSLPTFWDFILFVILPLIVSYFLARYNILLDKHLTDIITAVSILGGFLFNLLAIIYSVIDKIKEDAASDELKKIFVKEIHINISYNILISILSVISLILYSYTQTYCVRLLNIVLLGINYFLLINLFLTLLMVLNRIYILLKKDVL